jgi:hypothetical protein
VDAMRSARTERTTRRTAGCGQDKIQTGIYHERLVKAQTTQMRQHCSNEHSERHREPSGLRRTPLGMAAPEFYRLSILLHRN